MTTVADASEAILAQSSAFAAMALVAGVTLLAARWRWRARPFPHCVAWLSFAVYTLLVSAVPTLRQLDQQHAACYALRGLPIGLILASMLSLGGDSTDGETSTP